MTDSDSIRGWRVRHAGRDGFLYEELRDGAWIGIAVEGEMLVGRPHHVIYFAPPPTWRVYPQWARDRRDEIISRISASCVRLITRTTGHNFLRVSDAEWEQWEAQVAADHRAT